MKKPKLHLATCKDRTCGGVSHLRRPPRNQLCRGWTKEVKRSAIHITTDVYNVIISCGLLTESYPRIGGRSRRVGYVHPTQKYFNGEEIPSVPRMILEAMREAEIEGIGFSKTHLLIHVKGGVLKFLLPERG